MPSNHTHLEPALLSTAEGGAQLSRTQSKNLHERPPTASLDTDSPDIPDNSPSILERNGDFAPFSPWGQVREGISLDSRFEAAKAVLGATRPGKKLPTDVKYFVLTKFREYFEKLVASVSPKERVRMAGNLSRAVGVQTGQVDIGPSMRLATLVAELVKRVLESTGGTQQR